MRKISFQELNRKDTAAYIDEYCGFWIYGSSLWYYNYLRMTMLDF